MLSFLRRFSQSPVGVFILGLIALAFVVTLYEGHGIMGASGGAAGGGIASVGSQSISENDLERRAATAVDNLRQQQPSFTLAQFVNQGGLEQVLDASIDGRARQIFAQSIGLVASKKLVDGIIASIPAFNGPTGQFDPNAFRALLSERKLSERDLRDDLARDALARMLLVPLGIGTRPSNALAQPYANLLVESRSGRAQLLPLAAFAPKGVPSDQQLQSFYQGNVARYTLPEQRVLRLATFDRSRFVGKVMPSDAEIAADYKASASQYAGRETRTLTQAVVANEAQAREVYGKIKGGADFAAALRPLGLTPQTITDTDKASYARSASPALADAVFAAPRGQLAPLTRSPFGFTIVRVDMVKNVAARTLEQARPEIVARLAKKKEDDALAQYVSGIEDAAENGTTFDELTQKYALTPATLPPVTASGGVVDQPTFKAPPQLAAILRDAFAAEPEDDPAVAQAGQAGFVVWKLDRVVPSAPRPFNAVRAQVLADYQANQARTAAKAAADRLAAALAKGAPLPQAVASLGLALPPVQPLAAKRLELGRDGKAPPPALAALFSLAQGRARVLPGAEGFTVVLLDQVQAGDPRLAAALTPQVAADLNRDTGNEYALQFTAAVRAQANVKRDEGKFQALKRRLLGQP